MDFMWRFFDYETTCASYFGEFEVHQGGGALDPDAQYFMAAHPHGTVIFQRTFWRAACLERLFNRPWRMLGASVLFRIPIVREMTLWFGAVDASRSNVERLLRRGVNVVVWPGGLDEANSVDDQQTVNLRTRTGFIRLAVKHGASVLPVFVFGELDAVEAVRFLPQPIAAWLKRNLRISSNAFIGRYGSFIPRRVPFNLVLGKPIPTKASPAADARDEASAAGVFDAEVDRVHAAYKTELRRLYTEHKARFGYEGRDLVFTCESSAHASTRK